ncbi:MAG: molybdenum cofactor guanylyltransferase [Candidatus Humimicrobiaceae bacterium]
MSINLEMDLTGILLAGGKSRRLSFNKIEVRIDKIPLFIDQIFKLSFFCNEILISVSEDNHKFINNELSRIEDYYTRYYHFCNLREIPPVRIIKDKTRPDNPFKSMGPISGIESGLEYAGNLYSLVIAFDMPFITYNLLCLLEEIRGSQSKPKDAFIIKTEKGFEALCGIYSKNCLNVIEKNIEKKVYKISEIFHDIDTRFILLKKLNLNVKTNNHNLNFYKLNNRRIDNLNFFNINTVDDYNYFNKIWDLQIFSNQKFSKQVISNFNGDSANLFCEKWKHFFYRQ